MDEILMPGMHQASVLLQATLATKKTEIPDISSSHAEAANQKDVMSSYTEIQDISSSHSEAASQRDVISSYSGQSSKNIIPDGSKVYY